MTLKGWLLATAILSFMACVVVASYVMPPLCVGVSCGGYP